VDLLDVGFSAPSTLKVYPTPFEDRLFIQLLSNQLPARAEVFELSGRSTGFRAEIFESGSVFPAILDLSSLGQGVYLLTIFESKTSAVRHMKIIKL
jgi:hypothetical protein